MQNYKVATEVYSLQAWNIYYLTHEEKVFWFLIHNTNMLSEVLHRKCHNLGYPFLCHPIPCFSVYLSCVSFCKNKQIYVCFLILPFSYTKGGILCVLFLFYFLHLTIFSGNHFIELLFILYCSCIGLHCVYVLWFIQPVFYAWPSR